MKQQHVAQKLLLDANKSSHETSDCKIIYFITTVHLPGSVQTTFQMLSDIFPLSEMAETLAQFRVRGQGTPD